MVTEQIACVSRSLSVHPVSFRMVAVKGVGVGSQQRAQVAAIADFLTVPCSQSSLLERLPGRHPDFKSCTLFLGQVGPDPKGMAGLATD